MRDMEGIQKTNSEGKKDRRKSTFHSPHLIATSLVCAPDQTVGTEFLTKRNQSVSKGRQEGWEQPSDTTPVLSVESDTQVTAKQFGSMLLS